jgi:ribosomal protein S18 acetylase RimI-like enzyme
VEADAVESLLAEVRGRVPRGSGAVWWIGPSARPSDVYERLLSLGLREPRDGVSEVHALVLTREPADPEGVTVTRIETFEQFTDAAELRWDAFDVPEERRAANRARLREDYEESRRFGVPVGFLATVEGRPAGAGTALPSDRGVFLIAGATAPWARGRGIYRALVRARWDYAVARGTPALVTEAVADTSYPILRRLGFEDVATIRRLEDPGG